VEIPEGDHWLLHAHAKEIAEEIRKAV